MGVSQFVYLRTLAQSLAILVPLVIAYGIVNGMPAFL